MDKTQTNLQAQPNYQIRPYTTNGWYGM